MTDEPRFRKLTDRPRARVRSADVDREAWPVAFEVAVADPATLRFAIRADGNLQIGVRAPGAPEFEGVELENIDDVGLRRTDGDTAREIKRLWRLHQQAQVDLFLARQIVLAIIDHTQSDDMGRLRVFLQKIWPKGSEVPMEGLDTMLTDLLRDGPSLPLLERIRAELVPPSERRQAA